MPLYEYECGQCHRRVEKIQKFSDPELTVCPHCGGPLARTITAPAVQFKGGGWYSDLYSSAKPAAGSGDGKPASSGGGEAASTAKTESAPAAPAAAPAQSSGTTGSSTGS